MILDIRERGASVVHKDDGSPVTDADRSAEDLIVRGLEKIDPRIPIIAEERIQYSGAPDICEQTFFLVDPLDGTKEFVQGRTDFTVNICLVECGLPRLGVVVAPARNELFSGDGHNAFRCRVSPDGRLIERTAIRTSMPRRALRGIASASHAHADTMRFLERFAVGEILSVGSSLKFCLLAAGEADIYPRIGRTMQWDTAAGDAILRSAGGCTLRLDGQPLNYGPSCAGLNAYANPHFVSFAGQTAFLRSMLLSHEASAATGMA
nr:3'(2'),5'-bisphosphate nucleotidase CysQ [Hyphomicrobium denitrificans]